MVLILEWLCDVPNAAFTPDALRVQKKHVRCFEFDACALGMRTLEGALALNVF